MGAACCSTSTRALPCERSRAVWGDRITYLASDAEDRLGSSAMLVRPDGIVAWAADAAPDFEEAAEAAARWFGAPA